MEKNHTFVKPKNEATVKFYTEVQKIGWVSNPTHFYPRNQLELILPDVRDEHSLVYTPLYAAFFLILLMLILLFWVCFSFKIFKITFRMIEKFSATLLLRFLL